MKRINLEHATWIGTPQNYLKFNYPYRLSFPFFLKDSKYSTHSGSKIFCLSILGHIRLKGAGYSERWG